MCGLAGLLLAQPRLHGDALSAHAREMGAALQHRGPDDAGAWVDAQAGIGLAHQRLSILDLSPQGHQPMESADGRYVLAYNGELYNFAPLRSALATLGHRFRGHSDTEVLLAAIAEWGIEDTLQRCNGMFAIALWDRRDRCLWLARDRVGKKPMYYGWAGDAVVFGSELKALWRYPRFDNGVDRDALALLLRFNYIPAPYCIHERAFKLMPGSLLRLDTAAVAAGASAHDPHRDQRRWWDPRARMREAIARPFAGDDGEATVALDTLLRDSVGLRMVADVPVGVFLSGGTDSSVVAALMQAQSSAPVRSFTIGFRDSDRDEAPLAREVAAHLGTAHTEFEVGGADALAVVPQLPAMFDEPFADPSQIPTAMVCRLARQEVTVVLSGDGGDELFFGYGRYQRALRNWRMARTVPSLLRRGLARVPGARGESARTGGLATLLAESGVQGIGDVYRNRVSRWRNPAAVVPGAHEPPTIYHQADPLGLRGHEAEAMMLADFMAYLPDDLLCKVDRTSMAAGLEARAPLLDWRVVELAWSLPQRMKLREGSSKYLLKRMLRDYLPDTMVDRPKRGFGAPVGQWLRGDLEQWAGDLLHPADMRREGLFDADRMGAIWRDFLGGQRKWHTHLWNVLMFQAWHRHWRDCRGL
ncbi:asparagine synthase (glutamine-hydrolyzing) [Pseudoxanthomonas suwonensis 11-1]|uniref:asparagine synthase (glutamine-hydrolyzing) n=1 Tax=Pseudoxanthomonas suwonensis (strain 11-1) TaxID=743721 RepID=E6WTT4_PSEUU|nr:asparagine synthase (glutamine-hydrolyzing) [Pseudoxanthomonas suwonensis]ADV27583.1 asparagine synthase (glutamine-hydrolyzing) [Pseudoxanthomonas suwonensis 11-1]